MLELDFYLLQSYLKKIVFLYVKLKYDNFPILSCFAFYNSNSGILNQIKQEKNYGTTWWDRYWNSSFFAKDAKINAKELSEKLHISKTPIYERIKRLENEGYIKGYVALVDNKK